MGKIRIPVGLVFETIPVGKSCRLGSPANYL